jgi:hypothetical protein
MNKQGEAVNMALSIAKLKKTWTGKNTFVSEPTAEEIAHATNLYNLRREACRLVEDMSDEDAEKDATSLANHYLQVVNVRWLDNQHRIFSTAEEIEGAMFQKDEPVKKG